VTRKKNVMPVGEELKKLRQRASKVQAEANAGVIMNLRVPLEVYKKFVEHAETFHEPVARIARECLIAGADRYAEMRRVTHRGGLFSPSVQARYPDAVTTDYDKSRHLPRTARANAMIQARLDAQARAGLELDEGYAASTAVQDTIDALAAPLPSTAPIQTLDGQYETVPPDDTPLEAPQPNAPA
jgi:hypothetical protein